MLTQRKNRAILTGFVILAVFGGALYWAPGLFGLKSPSSGPMVAAAKSFTLPQANGEVFSLESFKGKGSFVLVHFWAAWCDPCVEEIPRLVEFARDFPGLKIVAISLDPTWEKAHSVWPTTGLSENLISVLDPKLEVSGAYGSFEFPETYLLRPDLTVQTKWIGPQEWQNPEVRKYFETLMGSDSGQHGRKR